MIPIQRMVLCTLRLFAAAAVLVLALSGATVDAAEEQAKAEDRRYVSKLELGLRPRWWAPVDNAVVEDALPDVMETISALSDERLTAEEIIRRIGWEGLEPLLIPAEASMGPNPVMYPGRIKRTMTPMNTGVWLIRGKDSLSFVVAYWNAESREVPERQTYQKRDGRWRLVKQERL